MVKTPKIEPKQTPGDVVSDVLDSRDAEIARLRSVIEQLDVDMAARDYINAHTRIKAALSEEPEVNPEAGK